MRWASFLIFVLFWAFALAGESTPLYAADPQPPGHDSRHSAGEAPEGEAEEFCYNQREICRKICRLRSRFEDRFDGCPQSCESREARCSRTGCYRWTESELLIAERFGGYQCVP